MRSLVVLALLGAVVGCTSEIAESEDIDTLTAMPDGSVVACVQRYREYQNGFADCCQSIVDNSTVHFDGSGRPGDRIEARSCPGYDSISAIRRRDGRIPLADGRALVIHEDTRGELCDVSAVDADGMSAWSVAFDFYLFPATSEPVGDFVFLGNGTRLVKLDWHSGSIAWSVVVHAF